MIKEEASGPVASVCRVEAMPRYRRGWANVSKRWMAQQKCFVFKKRRKVIDHNLMNYV